MTRERRQKRASRKIYVCGRGLISLDTMKRMGSNLINPSVKKDVAKIIEQAKETVQHLDHTAKEEGKKVMNETRNVLNDLAKEKLKEPIGRKHRGLLSKRLGDGLYLPGAKADTRSSSISHTKAHKG